MKNILQYLNVGKTIPNKEIVRLTKDIISFPVLISIVSYHCNTDPGHFGRWDENKRKEKRLVQEYRSF